MITILGADALAPFRKHAEEDCRTSQQYCSVHWSLHHFLQRKRIVPRARSRSRKTKIPFKTIGMLDGLAAVLLDAAHHLLVLAAIPKAELGDWLEPIAAPINWFCELYDPEGKRVGDSNSRTAGAMIRFSDRIAKLFAAVAHSRFWHESDMPRRVLFGRFRAKAVMAPGATSPRLMTVPLG